jgi:hypothetical protein
VVLSLSSEDVHARPVVVKPFGLLAARIVRPGRSG